MQMTFSRRESAYQAYRQYLEAGYHAQEPRQDVNLWVVEYKAREFCVSSKADLAFQEKCRAKRKYAKVI